MTVSTEEVARRYENVAAGVPIAVPFPLYSENEVDVYFGQDALKAVRFVDYGVALQPEEFDTFIITPTASLIAKIDALIIDDPTEVNAITIRSAMNYMTSSTPAAVRNTVFASREFDRTVRRLQELREAVMRALKLAPTFVGGDTVALDIGELSPGRTLMTNEAGTAIVAGPTADEVRTAQTFGEAATAAAEYIASVIGILTPSNYYLKTEIDAQQAAQNTAINDRALKTTTISGAGLVTGGGDLSTSRTLTVPKSTNAQALAGTDDATAMTPVRTKEAIAAFAPQAFSGGYTIVTPAQGTPKQNLTGKPMFVVAKGQVAANTSVSMGLSVGSSPIAGNNPQIDYDINTQNAAGAIVFAQAIVAPNEYYHWSGGNVSTSTIWEKY